MGLPCSKGEAKGTTHQLLNAKDLLALRGEVDLVHRHLPDACVPLDLGPEGSRDDLVAEADADKGNFAVLIRLTDVVDESQYPRLILEGVVLCAVISRASCLCIHSSKVTYCCPSA